MPNARSYASNGTVNLAFEQRGSRSDPAVLLIHGYTCQRMHWPAAFVDALVDRNLRVVTFDNRDAGESSHLDDLPTASFDEARKGAPAVYTLDDLASDAIAVLDHIGRAEAHVVGFSMGGMIGQLLAIHYPERVRSLTSMASSTGNPALPGAEVAVWQAFVRELADDRDTAIEQLQAGWEALGGTTYSSTKLGLGQLAAASYDRGITASGRVRQLLALIHGGNRCAALRSVTAPTLVIHGSADGLVPPAAAEDTARSIPGAELAMIDDMGHDLPDPLIEALANRVADHVLSAERNRLTETTK